MAFSYFSEVLNEQIKIGSLLATNEKLEKLDGVASDFVITGLTLSPHRSSGIGNLCGGASAGCINSCVLQYAGRRVMESVRKASRNRTALFFDNRQLFNDMLLAELSAESIKARFHAKKLLARMNVASDLPWERLLPQLFTMESVYRFYDYTAIHARALKSLEWGLPYDLTFSVKETTTMEKTRDILDRGGNVAIVVDSLWQPAQNRIGLLPSSVYIGDGEYGVVDGDVHDVRLREIDGRSKVILLRNKGTNAAKKHAIDSGFAKGLDISGYSDKPTIVDGVCRLEWLEV